MAATQSKETVLLMKYLEQTSEPLWVIKQSTLGGRGLFALQTIKKGSLVFTNKPFVVAPRADLAGASYCSLCFKISDLCYSCEKCATSICSQDCSAFQVHEELCNFIASNWKRKQNCYQYSDVLKQVQIYLHFLLLKDQQKVLLSIFQNCEVISRIEEIDNLCSKYNIPKAHIQFMEYVYSIIKINTFRIPNNSQVKKIPLRGFYPLSAFLNHSCIPNSRNVFRQDYTMEVYATKDINIGEEILTCYTGLLWCTPARRCQLYKTKHFWCKCARCEDRTEMGTNLSALKCLNKECVGVLLPMSPLNLSVEWLCDNCSSQIPASKICIVQSVLGSLVGFLDLDDQFRLDAPILARLANFIPYSNHIFIDIRLRLTLRLGFTGGLKLNGIHITINLSMD